MQTRALILSGYGLNCEHETRYAVSSVGGKADIIHLNSVISNPNVFENYNLFIIGGGFAHGDDLGAGKVLANKLRFKLKEPLLQFINDGKLIMGICNGFQVLVKLGLLPVPDLVQRVTFTLNDSGKFEDRWVNLKLNPNSPSIFTKGMDYVQLPVRHGEGKLIMKDEHELKHVLENNLHTAQYVNEHGEPAGYPYNPNGSAANIAALSDKTGRIFGIMPHPEAFNRITNHPYWQFGNVKEASGLRFFRNAVEYLSTL
jgi:phosphoribosylformylglycinamidine synthase